MLRVIGIGLLATQMLSGNAWVQDGSSGGRGTPTQAVASLHSPLSTDEGLRPTPIQYDEEHYHHGPVAIGCVHVPDECHHAAERAGYHHFRVVFDPDRCHHEPHLLCVADG